MNIDEIRKRRAAIDGAPWKYASVPDQRVYGTSRGGCTKQVSDYPVCEVRGWGHLQYMGDTRGDAKAQAMQDANGLFIACAPQDIDALLVEIDRLQDWAPLAKALFEIEHDPSIPDQAWFDFQGKAQRILAAIAQQK